MNKQTDLVRKFRALNWSVWLSRQFPVLVPYLMVKNATKAAFAKQGIKGEWPICFFEENIWYGNDQMFSLAEGEAKKYLKKVDAHRLLKICERGYKRALREIEKMNQDKKTSPLKQYQKVISLLEPINVSIWTTHASEICYRQEFKKKLARFVAPENIEKFISDVVLPTKKNAHALMEEDVLKGLSIRILHKKYAWEKSRVDAGFGAGYSLREIGELKKNILKNPSALITRPPVPASLRDLVSQLQDLVYLRTFRTDALFEIYFRAQPIFARAAKHFGVDSVAHYLPDDLLKGEIKRYDGHFAILKDYDQILVTKEKIVQKTVDVGVDVKGSIAWTGKAVGKVKIVFKPSEIGKVNEGDILVTNMTIPAYLLAMHKAAAFVTDEGGITCHAAIIAREMKKPCIIGTKIATKVLKDGDMVEVDAVKGIVRKIK